jgi:hypothetical protein
MLKPNTKNRMSKKGGQTLVEFALVSILFIFLLVITFNSIIAFSLQQYLAFATFMSARAYQAAGENSTEQVTAARAVLSQYIPGLPTSGDQFGSPGFAIQFPLFSKPLGFVRQINIPRGENGKYGSEIPSGSRFIGISFVVPLAEVPLGEEVRTQLGFVSLQTQSFLGREVSSEECRAFFKGFLTKYILSGANAVPRHIEFMNDPRSPLLMEDNGC